MLSASVRRAKEKKRKRKKWKKKEKIHLGPKGPFSHVRLSLEKKQA